MKRPARLPAVCAVCLWLAAVALSATAQTAPDDGTTGSASTTGGEDLTAPLAPRIPAGREPLDLVFSVPDSAPRPGSDLEIVRMGQAGQLQAPAALDLPERAQAVELTAWDWIRPSGRDIELAARDPYRIWLMMRDGMQGILVSDGQLELVAGTVEWRDRFRSAPERVVSAGPVVVRGRGTARIRRDGGEIEVAVAAGRFEVSRSGSLVSILGAGQHRTVALDPGAAPDENFVVVTRSAFASLRTELDATLDILLEGQTPDGASLARLWEATSNAAPRYADVERERASWVRAPESRMRDIATALRLLAAFRFVPPPSMGM